jgi:hypothetical protein
MGYDRELLTYYRRSHDEARRQARTVLDEAVRAERGAVGERALDDVWTPEAAVQPDRWVPMAVASLLPRGSGRDTLFLQGTLPLCTRVSAVARAVFPLALLAAAKALRPPSTVPGVPSHMMAFTSLLLTSAVGQAALVQLGGYCAAMLARAPDAAPAESLGVMALVVEALCLVRAESMLPLDAAPPSTVALGSAASTSATPPVVRRGLPMGDFWRAVGLVRVSEAALACGRPEAALLFLEQAVDSAAHAAAHTAATSGVRGRAARASRLPPRAASGLLGSSDGAAAAAVMLDHHPALFRQVYTRLGDADALHSLQADTSLDLLVRSRGTQRRGVPC